MFQSLIHQGKIASSQYERQSDTGFARVSIPYSSGKNCKKITGQKITNKRRLVVSIPYSSGKNCKIKALRPFSDVRKGVSIPYSSGKNCKSIRTRRYWRFCTV